jgi:hypothetical protein
MPNVKPLYSGTQVAKKFHICSCISPTAQHCGGGETSRLSTAGQKWCPSVARYLQSTPQTHQNSPNEFLKESTLLY